MRHVEPINPLPIAPPKPHPVSPVAWDYANCALLVTAMGQHPILCNALGDTVIHSPDELGAYLTAHSLTVIPDTDGAMYGLFRVFWPEDAVALAHAGKEGVKLGEYTWRVSRHRRSSISISASPTKGAAGRIASVGALMGKDTPTDLEGFTAWFQGLVAALTGTGIKLGPSLSSGGIAGRMLAQCAIRDVITGTLRQAQERAWNAAKGGRMESLMLGRLPESYCYDMVSAYPAILRDLPSAWSGVMQWVDSPEYHADAAYGFALIDVDIPEMTIPPLAVHVMSPDSPMELRFPYGPMRLWACKPEMDLLKDLAIPFSILEASWGIPLRETAPFRGLVDNLFKLRRGHNGAYSAAAKSIMVTLIGKMASVNEGRAASSWQPIYAAHIWAEQRCRLWRYANLWPAEQIAALCIDGLITTAPCPNPEMLSTELGGLRFEGQGETLMLNDYLKDRPGSHQWGDMAAKAYLADDTFNILYNRRMSLGQLKTDDADLQWYRWSRMGDTLRCGQPMPVGSATRQHPPITVGDVLQGLIPTGPRHIDSHMPTPPEIWRYVNKLEESE